MKKFISCLCINPHILNKICENAYIYMYIVLNFVYESIHTSIFFGNVCIFMYVVALLAHWQLCLKKKNKKWQFLYVIFVSAYVYVSNIFLSNIFLWMYAHIYLVALLAYWHLCRDKLIKNNNNFLYLYVFILCRTPSSLAPMAWGEKMKNLK